MSRHKSAGAYRRQPAPPPPRIPLDEMIARIELARLEEADPICPTCASRVVVTQTRICFDCKVLKPITAFARNTNGRLGREYLCKACKRVRAKPSDAARYRRRKAAQFRAILEGVAS